MALKFGDTEFLTSDGIPYVWGGGDTKTAPSFVGSATTNIAASSNNYYHENLMMLGYSTDIGSGRIVASVPWDNSRIYSDNNLDHGGGSVNVYDVNGSLVGIITQRFRHNYYRKPYFTSPTDTFYSSPSWWYMDSGLDITKATINTNSPNQSGIPLTNGSQDETLETKINFGRAVAVGSGFIAVSAPHDSLLRDSMYQPSWDGTAQVSSGLYEPTSVVPEQYPGVVYIYDTELNPVGFITAFPATMMEPHDYFYDKQFTVDESYYDLGSSYDPRYFPMENTGTTNPILFKHCNFGHSLDIDCGRLVIGAPNSIPGISWSQNSPDRPGFAFLVDLTTIKLPISNSSPYEYNKTPSGSDIGDGLIPPRGVSWCNFNSFGSDMRNDDGKQIHTAPYNHFSLPHPEFDDSNYNNDYFGFSVGIGNGRVVVGAPSSPINGNTSVKAGAIYLYDVYSGFIKKVINPVSTTNGDNFGWSVAVGSERIVVGAPNYSTRGAVFVFNLEGDHITTLTHPIEDRCFDYGYSVDVNQGRIVVGVRSDYWTEPTVNVSGHYLPAKGSVLVYNIEGEFIQELGYQSTVDDDKKWHYGHSVCVGENRIIVGSPRYGLKYSTGSTDILADGLIDVYSTPRNYTLHDAIDIQYG